MRAVRILLLVLIGVAFGAPAFAEPVTAAQQAMLGKPWIGTWTDSSGYIYNGVLALTVGEDGALEGTITWTLRRAPIGSLEETKVGLSAVEHVRGTYSPTIGALTFSGYAVDDTNALIGMDVYRLAIADDGSRIVGLTWANGPWDGRIEFLPQKTS